jgi:hypothetical protein
MMEPMIIVFATFIRDEEIAYNGKETLVATFINTNASYISSRTLENGDGEGELAS